MLEQHEIQLDIKFSLIKISLGNLYLYLLPCNIISFEQGNKQLYQVPNTNEDHWC